MQPAIQPAQYFALAHEVEQLINVYQSVNDPHTIETVQATTLSRIDEVMGEKYLEIETFKTFILDKRLTKERATAELTKLKTLVIPFVAPSNKQVEKVFRKTKKLIMPPFATMDLREYSYIGWNDPGKQKKFLLYYQEGKLCGLSGNFGTNVLKNACAICHHISNVSLFLAMTKTGGDGTYTKKGNYICVDSHACNAQLYETARMHQFMDDLK